MSHKSNPPRKGLAACLDDPEGVRLVAKMLETYRDLAKTVGVAPIAEALSASFALMDDANARSGYDEMRRDILHYLETLDDSDVERSTGARPEFQPSPDISTPELNAFAEMLLKKAGGQNQS